MTMIPSPQIILISFNKMQKREGLHVALRSHAYLRECLPAFAIQREAPMSLAA